MTKMTHSKIETIAATIAENMEDDRGKKIHAGGWPLVQNKNKYRRIAQAVTSRLSALEDDKSLTLDHF
jgi:hypothetical protein